MEIVKKIVLPSDMESKMKKLTFGWVNKKDLDTIAVECSGDDSAIADDIQYAIKDSTRLFLITNEYRIIEYSYSKKGFPILIYKGSKKKKTLHGYSFVPKELIEEACYFGNSDNSLIDMSEATIDNEQMDILFNLMIDLIV